MRKFKVGDKVWIFDHNHRVYPKDRGIGCGPIYSEHFVQKVIESETVRSWIVRGDKYPKSDPRGLYTDQMKEDNIWANENRRRIRDLVEVCPGETLRAIDAMISERNKQ